ncbi:DUF3558 domain-containing protein [Solihabitans fulvus]|uniref:DUF3558 domain-containing protein n=1 Tax=Solihabitans fulvus TaxID=1892852 RepID=UPI001CB7615A|nr:DUF3558 domain-containing protein [Solihabitans fulvus]
MIDSSLTSGPVTRCRSLLAPLTIVVTALSILAGCSSSTPQAGTSASPSSTWVSMTAFALPSDVVAATPRRAAPGDLCGLLTPEEVAKAADAGPATSVPGKEGKCGWSIGPGVDAEGTPDSLLLASVENTVAWSGTERGMVDGHSALRHSVEGLCMLRVAIRKPISENGDSSKPDDPILVLSLKIKGRPADVCPAAESLAKIALQRLPRA